MKVYPTNEMQDINPAVVHISTVMLSMKYQGPMACRRMVFRRMLEEPLDLNSLCLDIETALRHQHFIDALTVIYDEEPHVDSNGDVVQVLAQSIADYVKRTLQHLDKSSHRGTVMALDQLNTQVTESVRLDANVMLFHNIKHDQG